MDLIKESSLRRLLLFLSLCQIDLSSLFYKDLYDFFEIEICRILFEL